MTSIGHCIYPFYRAINSSRIASGYLEVHAYGNFRVHRQRCQNQLTLMTSLEIFY